MPRPTRKPPAAKPPGPVDPAQPRCGLCGATDNLTRTECCGNGICDDADQYVLFSFARSSCYRNHDRFTLHLPSQRRAPRIMSDLHAMPRGLRAGDVSLVRDE